VQIVKAFDHDLQKIVFSSHRFLFDVNQQN